MTAPSYSTNDPKGWCGDPRRGAAMGRPTVQDGQPEGELFLRRVHLRDGYDTNGTYFGACINGVPPLWWYADENGNVDAMLRARSAEDAIAQLIKLYPNARIKVATAVRHK